MCKTSKVSSITLRIINNRNQVSQSSIHITVVTSQVKKKRKKSGKDMIIDHMSQTKDNSHKSQSKNRRLRSQKQSRNHKSQSKNIENMKQSQCMALNKMIVHHEFIHLNALSQFMTILHDITSTEITLKAMMIIGEAQIIQNTYLSIWAINISQSSMGGILTNTIRMRLLMQQKENWHKKSSLFKILNSNYLKVKQSLYLLTQRLMPLIAREKKI